MEQTAQSTLKKGTHTISLLVNNKPGVLVRVALVFARRGYNIDALVVSPSFDPRFSRMTITAQGDPGTLEQIIAQAAKLVDVVHASEHSEVDTLHRELALIKIKNVVANRSVIAKAITKCKAMITYESDDIVIVEQTGTTDQLDELEAFLRKYQMVEMVRSGKLAMTKGAQST